MISLNYLRFERMKRDLRQIDVVELTGLSRNRYLYMESANFDLLNQATYGELSIIAKLYDMTVEELVNNYEKYNKEVL